MRAFVLSSVCVPALCWPAAARAQWNDSLLKPFTMNHRGADASSVDLSFLLDAPAGKDGFVGIRNGHLAKPDGSRLRLWGIHLTDWSRGSVMLPPKEDIPMWASTLARYGVNCAHLHFIDLDSPRGFIAAGGDSRSFDPQQLDRLDFLVAELKKRGIYIDLNLNVGRSYRAGDSVHEAADVDRARDGDDHAAPPERARDSRHGVRTRRGGEGDGYADRREANAGRVGAADRYACDDVVRRVGHAIGSRSNLGVGRSQRQ